MVDGSHEEHSRFPQRKKLPHDIPFWVPDNSCWFITINCDPAGKPQLCRGPEQREIAAQLLHSARFYHEMKNPKWFVHLFLLMPDHLHAVLSFPDHRKMKPTIKAWKSYAKRNLGIIWQSDFFDHRLRNQESKIGKCNYIRFNPVRKKLCQTIEEWPHWFGFDDRTGEEY